MYKTFVEGESYENLVQNLLNLDKVYTSLSQELIYIYLFVSGRIIFKYRDHNEGIERLLSAANIRETAWVNYCLGFSYCFNSQPLKGVYYLEKALERYEKNGQYINATWCNNYLGICYVYLKIYEKSEKHFKAALTGAEYFNFDQIFWHIYTNLSDLYFCMKNYTESKKWSKLALSLPNDSVLPACNYISAALKLNEIEEINNIFTIYLKPEYKASKYYLLLYFQYLKIFHIDDDIFYEAVTKEILPFYNDINYMAICRDIKLGLIEHFEKKRKYKEACCIYKDLLDYDL